MVRYSIFTLVRNAIAYHARWPQAWRRPQPKRSYDVVIVGGGGASALADTGELSTGSSEC